MAANTVLCENPSGALEAGGLRESWYAVQTRARHERVVMQRFQDKGLTAFLPVIIEKRRWSDRWKEVELPLFSCYVFVKIMATNEDRLRVLCTDSVFDLVGTPRQGTPIPDEQIEAVQTIVTERMNWETYPFLKIGQRVRIRSGSLTGVEGILVSRNGKRSVVVSVDAIQRSLAVRVEGYEIEAV
ncbi:MAG: UpxY family transcription antiterminator [Terriglobales bacterium]